MKLVDIKGEVQNFDDLKGEATDEDLYRGDIKGKATATKGVGSKNCADVETPLRTRFPRRTGHA
ncbi:MAG: hypothetical protein OSA98_21845, partial [Rubripirellula sp.]|nr:hypothetical protein [Rubripirellula sp.]